MKNLLIVLWVTALLFTACNRNSIKNESEGLSGDLIIFHAGSLSVPFKQIADAFEEAHPHVNVLREAAGSVACARKVTELKKDCDIMASSDYNIINKLLIPEYADWNIKFVTNEMVIAFDDSSAFADSIDCENWYKILLKDKVTYGRSDPNSDPCGYRTVLTTELASEYYKVPDLQEKLLVKDNEYMRPKETDLLALLETRAIDYMFIYRSVAEQHNLNYVLLPDSINLRKPELEDHYKSASVEIFGNKPGEYITQFGEPMVYGITICKDAPNKEVAIAFVKFLLSEEHGMKIMEDNGQPSVVPSHTNTYDQLPDELKKFAIKN